MLNEDFNSRKFLKLANYWDTKSTSTKISNHLQGSSHLGTKTTVAFDQIKHPKLFAYISYASFLLVICHVSFH